MPYGEYAKCPCCKKEAKDEAIEKKFGYRTMENGKRIPQSYCKKCRAAHCEKGKPCKVK